MIDHISKRRTDKLGGTDIASLFGLNKWKSPMDIWARIKGLTQSDAQEMNDAMEMGLRLEPVVADIYAERTGHVLLIPREEGYVSDKYPFMAGSPDRLIAGLSEGLEIKTAGLHQARFWGEDGDEIPDLYMFQVQWYIELMGAQWWDVAALIGGQSYREFHVERNERLIMAMIERASTWWDRHIIGDTPPEPDDTKRYENLFKRINPNMNRKMYLVAGLAEMDIAGRLIEYKRQEEEAKRKIQECRNRLIVSVSDAQGMKGITPDGTQEWTAAYSVEKEKETTDWRAVAIEAGATPELIAKHTVTIPERKGDFTFRSKEKKANG